MTGLVTAVGRSAGHTFGKRTEDGIRLLTRLGVGGDALMGRTVKHRFRVKRDSTGPNLRQVHLIHAELHDGLRAAGFDVSAGQMGENVTTRGVDLLGQPTGARPYLGGEASVRITGLRNPCRQLDGFRPGLMQAVLGRDRRGNLVQEAGVVGVVGVVVSGGEVRPGEVASVELPPGAVPPAPKGLTETHNRRFTLHIPFIGAGFDSYGRVSNPSAGPA